jgi:hypothetical protein
VAAATAALSAAPAHALDQLTCSVGSRALSYSPGLLNTPRTTTARSTDVVSGCVSLTDPTVTSGRSVQSFSASIGCTRLLSSPTSTQTYSWSNGRASTITFNSTVATVGGQTVLTSSGTVDSGAFAGAAVERVVTLVADLTACLQEPGLTSAGGPELLTILL